MCSMRKWNVHKGHPRQAGVSMRKVHEGIKPGAGKVGGNGVYELILLMP